MTETCYGCKHLKMRDSPNLIWSGFLCRKDLPRKGVLIGEVGGYERKCIHPMRQAENCFEYGVV